MNNRVQVSGEPEQPAVADRSKASRPPIAVNPLMPTLFANTRVAVMIGASPAVGAAKVPCHRGWHVSGAPAQFVVPVSSNAKSFFPDAVNACPPVADTSPGPATA